MIYCGDFSRCTSAPRWPFDFFNGFIKQRFLNRLCCAFLLLHSHRCASFFTPTASIWTLEPIISQPHGKAVLALAGFNAFRRTFNQVNCRTQLQFNSDLRCKRCVSTFYFSGMSRLLGRWGEYGLSSEVKMSDARAVAAALPLRVGQRGGRGVK